MIYTITIDIPEVDISDVTKAISKKYNYIEGINPLSHIEHMGNMISEDIKLRVTELRKDVIVKELMASIDENTITPWVNINIS